MVQLSLEPGGGLMSKNKGNHNMYCKTGNFPVANFLQ